MDRRLLVIANQSISDISSDGRTLKMLLREYNSECIAQFYLHGQPDTKVCNHFFRVSDDDMIARVLPIRKKSAKDQEEKNKSVRSSQKRNCRNLVLRELLWSTGLWWDERLEAFINDFRPEIVLLQGGDNPFMFKIAYRICHKRSIPLVIYNAESFLLRDELFFRAKTQLFWHAILKNSLHKSYHKCMELDPYCIYNTDFLEDDFQKFYPHPGKSTTIRMASESKHYLYQPRRNGIFTASYCGTLGGGRAQMLVKTADIMKKIDKNSKLIICGRVEKDEDKELFLSRSNVEYLGFVPYEKVQKVISESDILLECNGLDRLEARYYAFSTKIADCLMCGIPFLVYSSRQYPYVKYLEKNNAAFIAEKDEEVEDELKRVMENENYRISHLADAETLAKKNHSVKTNAIYFKAIIRAIERK